MKTEYIQIKANSKYHLNNANSEMLLYLWIVLCPGPQDNPTLSVFLEVNPPPEIPRRSSEIDVIWL